VTQRIERTDSMRATRMSDPVAGLAVAVGAVVDAVGGNDSTAGTGRHPER